MKPFIICAYATRGIYEDVYRENLKKSLDELKLENYVKFIEPAFDWAKNTLYKSTFAEECLFKFPDRNIILVDVDAKITRYPKLFEQIPEDYVFGARTIHHETYYRNGSNNSEILTGTFFINNNIEARFLVKEWIKASTTGTDQTALKVVVEKYKPKIYELPISYCYLTSLPWGAQPYQVCLEPIVEHYSVSRKTKFK